MPHLPPALVEAIAYSLLYFFAILGVLILSLVFRKRPNKSFRDNTRQK